MSEPTGAADHPPWGALITLSAGVSLIIIDATIVNVALPTIMDELDLTLTQAEWVNSTYALVFASLLILFGRLGDALGRKRVFLAGIVVFVGASLLAALAPSGGWLIAARVVQGIGGAAVLPSSLSLVNATFRGSARPVAFGVWGATIGGMAALGPLAGGALTEFAGWRWIFLVNLPLGAIVVVAALRLVPESRDPAPVRSWDVPGVITLSLGLALLVFGLIEGQTYGWLRPDQALRGRRLGVAALGRLAHRLRLPLLGGRARGVPADRAPRRAAPRRRGPVPHPQLLRRKRRRADRRARGVRPRVLHPPVPAERARALCARGRAPCSR